MPRTRDEILADRNDPSRVAERRARFEQQERERQERESEASFASMVPRVATPAFTETLRGEFSPEWLALLSEVFRIADKVVHAELTVRARDNRGDTGMKYGNITLRLQRR